MSLEMYEKSPIELGKLQRSLKGITFHGKILNSQKDTCLSSIQTSRDYRVIQTTKTESSLGHFLYFNSYSRAA